MTKRKVPRETALEKRYGEASTEPPLEFLVKTHPIGKARPRTSFKTGHVYKSAVDVAYEELLKKAARDAIVGQSVDFGEPHLVEPYFQNTRWPLALTARFYCHGPLFDLDNLVKNVMDALNGVVYRDDKNIVRIDAARYIVSLPGREHIEIGFEPLTLEEAQTLLSDVHFDGED